MKKFTLPILICSIFMFILISSSQAMLVPGGDQKIFNGKLTKITTLADKYKLNIGNKIMYIPNDNSKNSQYLLKAAKSLIHNEVTVIYTTTHDITSITPLKEKTLH